MLLYLVEEARVQVPFIDTVPDDSAATLTLLRGVILTTGCRELGEPTDVLAKVAPESLCGVVGVGQGDPGTFGTLDVVVVVVLLVFVVVVDDIEGVAMDTPLSVVVVVGTRINWTGGRGTTRKASILL